jgi:hypothetical protein
MPRSTPAAAPVRLVVSVMRPTVQRMTSLCPVYPIPRPANPTGARACRAGSAGRGATEAWNHGAPLVSLSKCNKRLAARAEIA